MGYGQFSTGGRGNDLATGSARQPQRKFVFADHANTCHVWAQQKEETRDGRSSDGRIRFEGATIFSYGSHFPMAHFTDKKLDGQRIVLVNARGYSVSTSKHQGLVRGALRGLDIVTVPVPDLKAWLDHSSDWQKGGRAKLRKAYHVDALESLAASLRSEARGDHWATPSRDALAQYQATRVALGIKESAPVDVVAWSDKRAARAAREMAARKLRKARGVVTALDATFAVSEKFDPARPEAQTCNAWQCGDYLNQIANRLREIGSARLTLGKSKRFPRLVRKASAALKAGRAIKEQWETLRVAAVARERRAADLEKLAEVKAWLATEAAETAAAQTIQNYVRAQERGEPRALWNFEETARLAGLAYREGDAVLGDYLRDNVSRKKLMQEVPETFKVETYGRPQLTAEQWQNGEGDAYYYGGSELTLLRKRGDELQTSRGARCPWSHAVMAFKVAQNVRNVAREPWQSNGHTIKVGTFHVDRIETSGDLVAGCHRLAWQEMQRLAIKEVPELVKPAYPLPVVVS